MKKIVVAACLLGILSSQSYAYGVEKLNRAPLMFAASHIVALVANGAINNVVAANVIGLGMLGTICFYDYFIRTQASASPESHQSRVIELNHSLDHAALVAGYIDGALFGRLLRNNCLALARS